MKWSVIVGIAALTCACGSDQSNSTGKTASSRQSAGSPPDAGAAADKSLGSGSAANAATQVVTLIGCLQGTVSGSDGTSGTRSGSARRPDQIAPDARTGAFRLVGATPAASGLGGVGANGAGGSGGPLVGGRTTFDLDAVPADALQHMNKQVRVTGRLDPTEVATRGVGTAGSQPGASAAGNASANTGAPAAGVGATAAGSGTSGSSVAAGGTNRRLTVDTIEVVAQTCSNP